MLSDRSSSNRIDSPPILLARPIIRPGAGDGGARPFPPPGLFRAGQVLTARVLGADAPAGSLVLSLAGQAVRVDAPGLAAGVAAGQVLTFEVVAAPAGAAAADGPLVLRRLDTPATAPAPGTPTLPAGADAVPAAPAGTAAAAVRQDLALALAQVGVPVDPGNLLAAQALVRFGVAITIENLSDIRHGLSARRARLPETIALAKSLGLPAASPAILRALDTLLAARNDPSLLTITVPLRPDTEAIGRHLRMAAEATTRSVEHKLLVGDVDGARSDLRGHLLRMAVEGGADAEEAALHLEGQMLVNAGRTGAAAAAAAAAAASAGSALFFGFTVAAAGRRAHYVEMQVEHERDGEPPPGGGDAPGKRVGATLRLPTAHLGLVTVRLDLATPSGKLSCRVSTPDLEGMRRIERSVGHLGQALEKAGFPEPVACAERCGAPTDGAGSSVASTGPQTPPPLAPRDAATRPLRALDLRV